MLTQGGKSSWKSRTLIITNSDVPLSDQVAQYYIAARGLSDQRLAYSFGTNMGGVTNNDSLMTNVISPIATYCATHDIKIVLCSAGVPENCLTLPNVSSQRKTISLSAVIAAARILDARQTATGDGFPVNRSDNGSLPDNCPYNFYNVIGTTYRAPVTTASNDATRGTAQNNSPYYPNWEDFRTAPSAPSNVLSLLMIGGRIGVPGGFFDGANTTPVETFANTKRIIDDAVQSEGTVGTVLIGITQELSSAESDGYEYSRRCLEANGYDVHHGISGISGNSLIPPPAKYSLSNFRLGAISPAIPAWGLYGGLINTPLNSPWINSVVIQKGAWCFHRCSNGLYPGAQTILNGGCCAAGSWNEPYSNGVVPTVALLPALLYGISMSEAVFAFGSIPLAWNMTVWGDPLYRPFATRRIPSHFPATPQEIAV